MHSKRIKVLLTQILVTIFATSSWVGQSSGASQNEALASKKTQLPPELKNLPLILDTKTWKIEPLSTGGRVKSFNLERAYGPGSGGGGGICALGITSASGFIVKNIEIIPFQNEKQRNQFLSKMTSTRFLLGVSNFQHSVPVNFHECVPPDFHDSVPGNFLCVVPRHS